MTITMTIATSTIIIIIVVVVIAVLFFASSSILIPLLHLQPSPDSSSSFSAAFLQELHQPRPTICRICSPSVFCFCRNVPGEGFGDDFLQHYSEHRVLNDDNEGAMNFFWTKHTRPWVERATIGLGALVDLLSLKNLYQANLRRRSRPGGPSNTLSARSIRRRSPARLPSALIQPCP